jgi:hypothetical protein
MLTNMTRPSYPGLAGVAVAPVRPAGAGALGLPAPSHGSERFATAPLFRARGIDLSSAFDAWSSSA